MRRLVFDILPLGAALLVVGVPVTLAAAFLSEQRLQGFAMYDPELGADPLAHQLNLVHAGVALLFCAAQSGALMTRKRTLGGSEAGASSRSFVKATSGLGLLALSAFLIRFTSPFFVLALLAFAWALCASALFRRFSGRARPR